MPVVLLVRHGQASFGADDYDVLSDLGREQSDVVGRELARRGLRSPIAMCGSLRRQRDTAEIALQTAGLMVKVRSDPRWDEYDHGALLQRYVDADTAHDGTSKGLQVLLDQALSSWVDDPGGGWPEFSGAATAALSELAGGLERGQDAVVFTSGGIIAAVCGALLGLTAPGVVALNRVTANGAITKVVVGGSGASLVSFNDHAHFEAEARALLTYR
jgi:broad specificity phosphatase PhoE